MEEISLDKNYRFRSNADMLLLDQNIRANAATNFSFNPGETIANLPAFWGNTQEEESTQIAEKICNILADNPSARIAILCRSRGLNAETTEQALSQQGISYFYGLFNEEDTEYIDFHQLCQEQFIHRFGNRRFISNRSLELFIEDIAKKYENNASKVESALLILLTALVEKVSTDYATISPEDKYTLLLDMFENRQLKQAMEYVRSNIIITTVHGAKGLEWEYVFLSDVERWIFPGYPICNLCPNKFASVTNYKCSPPVSLSAELKNALLDELSVFYVGITRARKQVYISGSATRYNYGCSRKSSVFSCLSTLRGIKLIKG
jgi:DNA helicase-2/ATP-dependent DNA helicase PcrA